MAAVAQSRPRKIAGTVELTAAQAAAMFDETARFYLGIGSAEFLRRWDKGEYSGDSCTSRVVRVASLISLVREERAGKIASRRARRIRTAHT
jgi:hypothetical protein